MLIQTKIQIEPENYSFIKKVYKELEYRSLSEYIREAINAKVRGRSKKTSSVKEAKGHGNDWKRGIS